MTVLGLIAGALTTLSFLPQVIRTIRSRSAHDLSWSWLLLFAAGLASWLLYGALTSDLPIMVTNATTLAFVVALAGLKASPSATIPPAASTVGPPRDGAGLSTMTRGWWADAVGYEVDLPSFCDGTGDGCGEVAFYPMT